jgi:hypothetical protein
MRINEPPSEQAADIPFIISTPAGPSRLFEKRRE